MPRHPPCALHSLSHKHNTTTTTTKTRTNTPTTHTPTGGRDDERHRCKMLASTMQISNNKPTKQATPPNRVRRPPRRPRRLQTHPDHSGRPDPSGPNSVPTPPTRPRPPGSTPTRTDKRRHGWVVLRRSRPTRGSFIDDSTSEHHQCHPHGPAWKTQTDGGCAGRVLLRKEVIQPHLPVRLPCYDFVPIASPTFDGSLPQGVRPPASGVADFRDVTGGVYKARERIHRSVADLRLLATPTSWGRVADPNPN